MLQGRMDRLVVPILVIGILLLLVLAVIQYDWIGGFGQELADERARRELTEGGMTCPASTVAAAEAFTESKAEAFTESKAEAFTESKAEVVRFNNQPCAGFNDGPPGFYQYTEDSCYLGVDHELVTDGGMGCSTENTNLVDANIVKDVIPAKGVGNCVVYFNGTTSSIPTMNTYLKQVRYKAPSVVKLVKEAQAAKAAYDAAVKDRTQAQEEERQAAKDAKDQEAVVAPKREKANNAQDGADAAYRQYNERREAAVKDLDRSLLCTVPDALKGSSAWTTLGPHARNWRCYNRSYVYRGPYGIHSNEYNSYTLERQPTITDLGECAKLCDANPDCAYAHIYHRGLPGADENQCRLIKANVPWQQGIENRVDYYVKDMTRPIR